MKAKFVYVGVRVKNMARSVKFYTTLLGMKNLGRSTVQATNGETTSLQSSDGKFVLELNYPRNSSFYTKYVVGEGLDHLAFGVPDLDAALAEARKAGHPVVKDIRGKVSRWAYVKDPNGIWIELFKG